jgi:hypothetical protein
MRQRNILGLPNADGSPTINNNNSNYLSNANDTTDADMKELDPDHQLLLMSSMPLLKSRNAGVTLAVCSLHYYCGVSSIRSRSAMGKALVRIHRGRREIQYVVLTSIRVLVQDCPSAFAPFLPDFFVKVCLKTNKDDDIINKLQKSSIICANNLIFFLLFFSSSSNIGSRSTIYTADQD